MSSNPYEVWPQGTGGLTTAEITISTIRPASYNGCKIDLRVEPVEDSGGHMHDGARPHGRITPSTITIPACTMGISTVTYTSSEVSGEEGIIAEVNGQRVGEAMVNVRVPRLVALGGGDTYRLTGGTSTHPNNHYGTPETNARIRAMARDYFEATGIAIGINDMSLPLGGLFDIYGNWSPPHKLHRLGKSVDVDHLGVKEKRLNKIAEKYSCKRLEVERIHYECP
ncbi:MAG: hypothetical protein Fur0020_05270 [Thermodesulfovibrionia bacterium]